MGNGRLLILGLVAALTASCDFQVKVPITDVNARFTLSDATWFEEEETLFVFWRVEAEQGLGPESLVEISWRTDIEERTWTDISTLPMVHTHLPVDCGEKAKCGSASVHIPLRPRDVQVRLRYHRDGEMSLRSQLNFNAIGPGPAHTHRSLIVYGVFDETNTRVQWRARHQFPAVRNHEAQDLGLRRRFTISDQRYGALAAPTDGNPYGYGFAQACPSQFLPLGFSDVATNDRAFFHDQALPPHAYASPALCARATVTDARGDFATAALGRKNPEVAPAFPLLHSPIREDLTVPFMLRMCQRTLSEPHRAMQQQRLLLEGAPEICIDGWAAPGFAGGLATQFRAAIDARRAAGRDMVLIFSLHHDDGTGQLAAAIEAALAQVLPLERDKSSPRVTGAFVFDTFSYTIASDELRRLVLWCPANALGDDLDTIPAASERSCPILPDIPDLKLGPFRFNTLPILPTRAQYLTFLSKYSDAQAGKTKTLTFRAPERTPLSENVAVGEFGVATFFNNEIMTAEPTDRFSYCAPEDGWGNAVVFRVQGVPEPVPLALLPEVQEQFPQTSFGLGLVWDFPFFLRLEYETAAAGAATVATFTVPFGVYTVQEQYLGTQLWEKGDFPLSDVLLRCTRFCEHPTFDSAAVYNVSSPFVPTFRNACYRPAYPKPGDGGFPLDP